MHFDPPGRRDAHFRLGFAPNAALINGQGHTHTTTQDPGSRAIRLASLPPANAFGPCQDAFPQAIARKRYPAFHRLIGEQLVDRGGALTRLSGVSDVKLQTIVERIEAQISSPRV